MSTENEKYMDTNAGRTTGCCTQVLGTEVCVQRVLEALLSIRMEGESLLYTNLTWILCIAPTLAQGSHETHLRVTVIR